MFHKQVVTSGNSGRCLKTIPQINCWDRSVYVLARHAAGSYGFARFADRIWRAKLKAILWVSGRLAQAQRPVRGGLQKCAQWGSVTDRLHRPLPLAPLRPRNLFYCGHAFLVLLICSNRLLNHYVVIWTLIFSDIRCGAGKIIPTWVLICNTYILNTIKVESRYVCRGWVGVLGYKVYSAYRTVL